MAGAADKGVPSVCSISSIKTRTGEMEVLPSEGSTVYMTEVDSTLGAGKPSPEGTTTTLIGVPRKALSYLEGDGESSSSESPPHSPASVLKGAGVELNLGTLTADGGSAPMDLLSQFMSCIMREEYEAAQLLCEKVSRRQEKRRGSVIEVKMGLKVLEFEPNNPTVLEFLPVIKLRLELDAELSSEESSEESSETDSNSSSSSSASSSDDENTLNLTSHRHCTHHH